MEPEVKAIKETREYVSFKTLMCGDREIRLRYGAGALFSIRDTAAKLIGDERLQQINYKPINGKVPGRGTGFTLSSRCR